VPKKGGRKKGCGGGDELAAENCCTGKVKKRQDTERGYHKCAGTRDYIDRQNQEKEIDCWL